MRTLPPLFVLVLFLGFANHLNAQINRCAPETGKAPTTGQFCLNAISTAVPFLGIVPDARSAALGNAGVAISPDANAMHFNASKLVFAEEDLSIAATYTPWLRALGLNDVYMAYLTGFKKIDEFQAVGLGLRYFSLGSIQFTDTEGNALNTGRPYEFEINGAYSRKLGEKLSASIGAKFIYSDLASGQQVDGETIEAGAAGAADIGFTYQSPIKLNGSESFLRLGLALTNLGSKITYTNSINRDYLPANLGLGAAWEFELDEYNSLTTIVDINKLLVPTPDPNVDADGNNIPDYREKSVVSSVLGSFNDAPNGFNEEMRELNFSLGLEYWYDKQFAVRAGYFYEHESKGNRKFLTVGLGLKYNVFGLNLSYLVPTTNQQNPLDNTLRFSLVFDFGVLDDDAGN